MEDGAESDLLLDDDEYLYADTLPTDDGNLMDQLPPHRSPKSSHDMDYQEIVHDHMMHGHHYHGKE